MSGEDPFRLARFVAAQVGAHDDALAELRAGRKRSHWMWFVFPQAQGLGHSPTARFYAIGSINEAQAYLVHPVLAPRLLAATEAAAMAPAVSLNALFGSPDDMKFISSMTLFAMAAEDPSSFQAALDRWNAGRRDERTLRLMAAELRGGTSST